MIAISNPTLPKSARIRCFVREPCSTSLSQRCRSHACDLWSNASELCSSKSRCSLAFMGPSENEGIHEGRLQTTHRRRIDDQFEPVVRILLAVSHPDRG